MKSMIKKLLVLFTGMLLIAVVLSSCGIDSKETAEVSDEARQAFIQSLLNQEGAELIYSPLVEEKSDSTPPGYSQVSKSAGGQTGLTGMSKILKNESYELYIDFATTDIAVLDLKTGFAYHSNPNRDPDITLSASLLQSVASPLSLEAFDASGKRYSFNFYGNCQEDGSFYVVKTGDDSFRLIYTIGNDPDKDLFPPVITEDTWENKIMKGLNDKLADGTISQKQYDDYLKLLGKCYRYMTPKDMTIETKERFKTTFPTIDVMTLYVSYDSTSSKNKSGIKGLMETIGFTAKDVKKEMEKADYQGPERSVLYTIPVDLTLNEDGLKVNVDASLILGPTKQRMYSLNIYRGLGATKAVYENTYMIVPDGSGAVIPANGALSRDVFKDRVYGADGSFSKEYNVSYAEQVLAPYLILDRGVLPEDATRLNAGGIIAIMEDGAAQASVVARPIAGTSSPVASINYEVIYSERDYRTYSTSSVAGEEQTGSGLLLSKDKVTGVFSIQYLFTEGGLSYTEYANRLRDYFTKKELFPTEKLQQTELPLFIDLLGSVELSETILGVPVKQEKPLTSYKQAAEILQKLKDAGVNNVVTRYTFWANGGEDNVAANDVELLNCMGSAADLDALIAYCNDNGMGFFPSVDFLHVSSMGNGFSKSQDSARRMNRSTATIVERMNAHGGLREDLKEKILVSSSVSVEMAESYKASFEKVVGVKSIALGELGKELHSNYKTNGGVTRMWAEKDHVKVLQSFDGYDIAVSTGNFYTWKYASHIYGLPAGSSEYLMESSAIPFTQIMLHGYVNYSTDPVNQTGDYETALLLALETGASFSFRWMAEDDSIFDYTYYYNNYSLNYTSTIDRAVKVYKEAAAVLNDVLNEEISNHEKAAAFYVVDGEHTPETKRVAVDGVFATTYGDKKVVVVNYNAFDVELNDGEAIVGAKSYKVYTLSEYKKILDGSAAAPLPEVPAAPVEGTEQEG